MIIYQFQSHEMLLPMVTVEAGLAEMHYCENYYAWCEPNKLINTQSIE